jgi:hemoglobin
VAQDTVINGFFAGAVADTTGQRIARLKSMLVTQICQATCGLCTYTGLSIPEAHQEMNINDSQFDALVGDLVRALDAYSVPTGEKNELLGILGPLRSQIVGQHPG